MAHLSPQTFIDVLDGRVAEHALPHLASCAACRQQLHELRHTCQYATEADVPEPSPLFWEHLSARVREAVAAEPARRAPWWQVRWSWNVLGGLAAATAAVILVVSVQPAFGPHVGARPGAEVAAPGPAAEVSGLAPVEPLTDDESIGFVADLASGLDWDDVAALDAGTQLGSGQGVADLDAAERTELQRLLNEALAGGV